METRKRAAWFTILGELTVLRLRSHHPSARRQFSIELFNQLGAITKDQSHRLKTKAANVI
ncbi:hypothetical protein OUZ56_001664 [Daphnia magna]|uniref:Uncharacterized protein n=1 Tax=Daphnia magna TaxID=35525 RepID=A0ABR0A3C9_9CRUS|nr:hypothetical protein OUZ56_001664 [Daphnia magna]